MHSATGTIIFALAFVCNIANAETILIGDLTEGPVTVTGAANASRLVGVNCVGETCTFSINAPAGTILVNAVAICPVCGALSPPNINLFENATQISDTLQLLNSTVAGTQWRFISDDTGALTPLPAPATNLFGEDGSALTVVSIKYSNLAGVVTEDFIQIQSDADVPEPSTWLMLLASGPVVFVARAVRSRSTARHRLNRLS